MNNREISANAKAFAIYRQLKEHEGRITIPEISRRTGVSPRTAQHIIDTRGWQVIHGNARGMDVIRGDEEGPQELRF